VCHGGYSALLAAGLADGLRASLPRGAGPWL